ncbi:MAG: tRNA uridine-5-carboxymethylaminomethyl(34) synthesis GTPase MnmE, partial [Gammaproteobacteria bacterium]|nr:tRNA uridine-5-carboxymethylaminomethyl(34) synthesis GTPase MnmE [Gammaproteobacteria bacterium]
LKKTAQALEEVLTALSHQLPGDLLAQDIRQALHHLGEITGEITTDDLLGEIFSKFCIGK